MTMLNPELVQELTKFLNEWNRRSMVGHLEIPPGAENTDCKREFETAFMAVETGWQRTMKVTLSADKRRLDFSVIDVR